MKNCLVELQGPGDGCVGYGKNNILYGPTTSPGKAGAIAD